MNHLSSNDLGHLAGQLQTQRQALLGAIRQRLHHGETPGEITLGNYFAEVREQAEANLLADTDIGQLQLELAELEGIEGALVRIADGSYGDCADCGKAIALRRLQAQPAARLCLQCQERHEHQRQARAAPAR